MSVADDVEKLEEENERLDDKVDGLEDEIAELKNDLRAADERIENLLRLLDLTEHEAEVEGVYDMTRERFAQFLADRRLVA